MPVFKEIIPIYEEVLGWQPPLFPFKARNYANVCIGRFPPEVVNHRHAILTKTICLKTGRGRFARKSTSLKLFSPDVSRFAHVYLSFFKPETRNMRAKTVTTHVDQQFFPLKTSPQIYKRLKSGRKQLRPNRTTTIPSKPCSMDKLKKKLIERD